MLPKSRRMLRRRAIFSLLDCLFIILLLLVWVIAGQRAPMQKAISYSRAPSQVIVQLATLTDQAETDAHAVPRWTLYGDGTLIFRADPDENLWRAHLSPREIQHVLDVIINQNKFFDTTAHSYGGITSARADDNLLLTVDANGQRKAIVLVNDPVKGMAIDSQTAHVFAIERLLQQYQPAHPTLYVPNPDGDLDSDNG